MARERAGRVTVKRVYDAPTHGDGVRILVDRLWPRGLAKDDASLDEWCKELAPTTALRKFYGHRPELFEEFSRRYRAELNEPERVAALKCLQHLADRRHVTLLTATQDVEHSGAAVLAAILRESARRSR
jgi:uncharacterized protein YeaO (DUF488 family)